MVNVAPPKRPAAAECSATVVFWRGFWPTVQSSAHRVVHFMRFRSVARSTRSSLCIVYTRLAWSTVHVVPIASHVDDVDVDCCTVCCSDTHGRSPRPCATPLFECLLLPHGRHWCSCVVYTVERRSRTPVGGVGEHERRGACETREVVAARLQTGCVPFRRCSDGT